MGKTEEDWNGLKLGFLKTVQPNSFSKLISAVCNFKNNAQETYIFVCLESLILSFPCNFLAYFKFHTDWGRVIGKIKQNELKCCDTAPLILDFITLGKIETKSIMNSYDFKIIRATTICRLTFLNSKNKNFLKSEIK